MEPSECRWIKPYASTEAVVAPPGIWRSSRQEVPKSRKLSKPTKSSESGDGQKPTSLARREL